MKSICPAADGSLVAYLHAPYLAGVAPRALAITSRGTDPCDILGCSYNLFVVNEFSNDIWFYTAVPTLDNITGLITAQLKPNNPALISTGMNPVSLAITSSATFAFVANSAAASITSYAVRSDGVLLNNGSTTSGQNPSWISVK